ncbi:hypothetical protein G7Y89_g8749 [Cudoniella acicularis]|uniref:Uncharacterized protein n=1 Tax=Cudoniella acicularis TaxID=354080 RepID=A0A8H4W398_9HELO|nr:hypothetical protein G7Y89_g8749 [Cudoniella acicularis]
MRRHIIADNAIARTRAPERTRDDSYASPEQQHSHSNDSFASQVLDPRGPTSISTNTEPSNSTDTHIHGSISSWDDWSCSTLPSPFNFAALGSASASASASVNTPDPDPKLWSENVSWDIRETLFNDSTFNDAAFASLTSSSDWSTATSTSISTTCLTKDSSAPPSVFLPFSSQASTASGGAALCAENEGHRAIDCPLKFTTGRPDIEDEDSNGNRHARKTYTQRLSRINSQLSRISQLQGTFTINLDMLLESAAAGPHRGHVANPVGDIMKSTYEFLQVLKLLADQHLRPTPKMSPGQESTTLTSPLFDPISPKYTMSSSPPFTSSDPTTSLLILTCYIHLLRVYVLLFESICSFLKQVADSDEPYLQPVSGLSFSHLSLDSGNLQATLFIQIVTSLFERVERFLGLPSEFRIDHNAKNGGGLLSHEDFGGIVEIIIRKEELRQPGTGGIKTLCRSIKMARELLRDNIAP